MAVIVRRVQPGAPAPATGQLAAGKVDFAAWLDRHAAVVAVLLIAANVVLKLRLVGAQGIWFDEAITMKTGQFPFDLGRSLAEDATPPLYTVLLHAWMHYFGISLESARVFSVVLSSLTAALVFLLGRRFLDPASGFYAALLFTLSRYQLHYGHEARPYALVGLLCAASFYALLSLLERPGRGKLLLLAVLDAAVLYTHYVGGVLFAAQLGAALLPAPLARRNLRYVLASQVLAVLLFVPWVFRLVAAWPLPMAGWLPPPGPRQAYYVLVGLAGSPLLLGFEVALVCGGLAAIVRVQRGGAIEWAKAWALGAWALLPLVLAFAASYVEPIFLDRYLLYVSLGIFLLVAYVVVRLPAPPLSRHALALTLCALSFVTALRDPLVRTDWRGASERVQQASLSGALTVVSPSHQLLPLAYHLAPNDFGDQDHLVEHLGARNVLALQDLRAVADFRARGGRTVLLVLTDAAAALHPELPRAMTGAGFELASTEELTGLVLMRFEIGSPVS